MDAKQILGSIETITDRENALELVKKDGTFLKQLSPELKKDKEFVIEAVKQNPIAILFADESLTKDEDVMKIVKTAVKDAIIANPITILLADESFISDNDVMDIVSDAMNQTNLLKNKQNLEQIETPQVIEVSISDGEETYTDEINFILVESNPIEEIKAPESYSIKQNEIDYIEQKKLTTIEIPIGDPDTNFMRGFDFEDEDFILDEQDEEKEEDDFIEEFDNNEKYLDKLKKENIEDYLTDPEDKTDNLDVYIKIDDEIAKKQMELTKKEIERVKEETTPKTIEQLKKIVQNNEKEETSEITSIEDAIKSVSENGLSLESLPLWQDNLIVVATAIVQNKNAVKYASDRLQIEDDVLLLLEDIPQEERVEYLDYLIKKQNNKDEFEARDIEKQERKEILKNIFDEKKQELEENNTSFSDMVEKAKQYIEVKKHEIKRKLY